MKAGLKTAIILISILVLASIASARSQQKQERPAGEQMQQVQSPGFNDGCKMNLVVRKREVYEQMATAMRMSLDRVKRNAGPNQGVGVHSLAKSYCQCYLWAPDEVMNSLDKFVDLLATHSGPASEEFIAQGKALYAHCLREMRKDAGFPSTQLEARADRVTEN